MVAKQSTSAQKRPAHWDESLSPKQEAIFAFVRRYFREHKEGPTASEIAAAVGSMSEGAVRYNLKALERADILLPIREGNTTSWSPTGARVQRDAELWRLVDEGVISWSGGKPKGPSQRIDVIGEGYISDFVHQDRR